MTGPLRWRPVYRICVFVPPDHLEAIRDGILAVHALGFGGYDQVMWISAEGWEQFRPLAGAQPAAGEHGRRTVVPSVRLEFALPRDRQLLERVIGEGILPRHPWECPAIFVDESLFPEPAPDGVRAASRG